MMHDRSVSGAERATKAAPRLSLAVQYAVASRALPRRATLRRWARAAVDRDATVTLRFVGKREGRTLNVRYRGRESATNVLTFVYDEKPTLSGDVILCAPVLRQEARAQRKPLADHCAHLVVHGILHLQGYDHQTERDARVMEARETAILAALGMPDPYTAPTPWR
ncbi:MAG: rRNA maturation RNase YbeY [Betaproteobacteria bacterium]